MNWRAMQAVDLDAVSAVSDRVHGSRYSEDRAVYAERLSLHPAGCFVLERGNSVTGYLITHPWRRGDPPPLGAMLHAIPEDADRHYLHDLALLPAAQGIGAGAAAVALVVAQAERAGRSGIDLVAVAGADSFWAAHGFQAVTDGAVAARVADSYGPEARYMSRETG